MFHDFPDVYAAGTITHITKGNTLNQYQSLLSISAGIPSWWWLVSHNITYILIELLLMFLTHIIPSYIFSLRLWIAGLVFWMCRSSRCHISIALPLLGCKSFFFFSCLLLVFKFKIFLFWIYYHPYFAYLIIQRKSWMFLGIVSICCIIYHLFWLWDQGWRN